jgi:hypothetical protein
MTKGKDMFSGLDIVIYAAVAVGYVAILALTERSAGRYVRGETSARPEARIFVVAGQAAPEPAGARRTVRPEPVVRETLPRAS